MKREQFVSAIVLLAAAIVIAVPARAANVIDNWTKITIPAPAPQLKSVTIDPKTTALLLLDFTHQICNEKTKPRCVASLPAVKKLLTQARDNHLMVVYSTAGNMTPKDIWADIAPTPGEPVVN